VGGERVKELKIGFSLIGGAVGYLLGGFDIMLTTLLLFIAIDYVTGVMRAIVRKQLSSEIGFKGIFGKIIILCLVALATRLDNILGAEALRYLVISFYIANEGISILENTAELDVPYPQKLKDVLEQLRKEEE
jgi:toxin secretion/phage lysis holin